MDISSHAHFHLSKDHHDTVRVLDDFLASVFADCPPRSPQEVWPWLIANFLTLSYVKPFNHMERRTLSLDCIHKTGVMVLVFAEVEVGMTTDVHTNFGHLMAVFSY